MSRNILVISNSTNTRQMIQSDATTRRELEVELENAGIETRDMSFFEGLTRTDLVDSNSQLPARAMYKGQWTTDLIITLTPSSIKKVANGSDRAELYEYIRENDLQSEIYNRFGMNFTNVKTSDLQEIVDEYKEFDREDDVVTEQCCATEEDQTIKFIGFLNELKAKIDEMIYKLTSPIAKFDDLDIDELMKEFGK